MRICVVSPSANAYSETFIRAHIEGLEAEVLEGDWPFVSAQGREFVGAGERVGMDLGAKLQKRGYRLGGQLAGFLRRHGEVRLRRWLHERGIGAVLAEYGTTGSWLLPVCRAAGVGLVVHFHGADAFERQLLEEYGAGYRELFAAGVELVAVSEAMKRQLECLGARPEKITVNSCGVDLKRFAPGGVERNGENLLAVGRFVDKKAPHLAILAFARIAGRWPRARLDMVGDGPLHDACEQMVEAMTRAGTLEPGQVKLLGRQKPEQVAERMAQARIFVQHSVQAASGDAEGTPVAVLEAAASGLPVVSTRHMGICEAVVDGETGYLVEERDIAGMAVAMERLLADGELAGRLGRAGRVHMEQNYAMEKQIAKLRTLLEAARAN